MAVDEPAGDGGRSNDDSWRELEWFAEWVNGRHAPSLVQRIDELLAECDASAEARKRRRAAGLDE
jgi:hypothetical protein